MAKTRFNDELKLVCQLCEERFTNSTFRLFCGAKCRSEYLATLDRHTWTKEEEDYIISLIGLYPVKEIVRKARYRLSGEVTRTAIKEKVMSLSRREGTKISDRVDNHSIEMWAKLLGNINDTRVWRWLEKGLTSKKIGNRHMVSHKMMITFAKEHPSYFQSIERQYLEWLFADELAWVDIILKSKPSKPPVRKVLCVTTGRVFASLTRAASFTGISRFRITGSIQSGIPTQDKDGKYLEFRFVD